MGTMKVILSKDIPSLGEEGEIKVVKKGYARNYLLPKGLAVICSKKNLEEIEKKKEYFEKRKIEKIEFANKLKQILEEKKITVKVSAGEKGRLFGTVTSLNILDELSKDEQLKNMGVVIDKKQIELKEHIKFQGTYKYRIHLYRDIYANMELIVEAVVEKPKEREQKTGKRFHKGRRNVSTDKGRESDNKSKEEEK